MELYVGILLLFIGIQSCFSLASSPEESNLCPVEERFTVNVTQLVLKIKKIRQYKWCVNYPPRCSYYTTEEQYVPEVTEEEKTRQVLKCCPGFEMDENSKNCVFKCSNNCINGNCALNECDCNDGFWGETCNKTCETGKWGKNCKFECSCTNGLCDVFTGDCVCQKGWSGSRCEEPDTTQILEVKTTTSTEAPIAPTTQTDENYEKSLIHQPEHTKYSALEKYITFQSTSKPINNSSDTDQLANINEGKLNSTITNTEPNIKPVPTLPDDYNESKHNREFVNNETTDDLISITQFASKSNLKAKASNNFEFSTSLNQKEVWLNDDSGLHAKDHVDVNRSQLIFSVAGVVITAIFIIMLAIFTTNRLKAIKEGNAIIAVAGKPTKNDDKGITTVAFYTPSVFHPVPQSDLPIFENSEYLIPIELDASKANGSILDSHMICNLKLPNYYNNQQTPSTKNTLSTFYDHPPSSGSYKAASIPEPPEELLGKLSSVESKEHLYDEIPCWNQPLVNEDETLPDQTDLYANTLKR